jgi:non-canonical (house-cleaning) NTP pyrophosphatase
MADHNLIGRLTGEHLIDVTKGSIALLGNGKISRTQLRWI